MNIVEEYYKLGQQEKMIKARRKKLRDIIVNDHITELPIGYKVTWQTRKRQKVDDLALEQLLVGKGLWEECCMEVVNHDLVEQAYIEGKITDEELRSIDGGRDITVALVVERIDDVQGKNVSDSGRQGDGAVHDRSHGENTKEVSRNNKGLGAGANYPQADFQTEDSTAISSSRS